jgi:hypothetical protein
VYRLAINLGMNHDNTGHVEKSEYKKFFDSISLNKTCIYVVTVNTIANFAKFDGALKLCTYR